MIRLWRSDRILPLGEFFSKKGHDGQNTGYEGRTGRASRLAQLLGTHAVDLLVLGPYRLHDLVYHSLGCVASAWLVDELGVIDRLAVADVDVLSDPRDRAADGSTSCMPSIATGITRGFVARMSRPEPGLPSSTSPLRLRVPSGKRMIVPFGRTSIIL